MRILFCPKQNFQKQIAIKEYDFFFTRYHRGTIQSKKLVRSSSWPLEHKEVNMTYKGKGLGNNITVCNVGSSFCTDLSNNGCTDKFFCKFSFSLMTKCCEVIALELSSWLH
ncbi:hypothetical protein CDAR_392221 [Caerostris darwini]|uniref:Uncharacterized protein n=1 Tax=Caerostris darwini TaxID=1538125 RepID=A0AAV4SPY2_9ARAC|nr:hypothetical protein CDAR_392221 [Caerostris darwini]